MELCIVFDRMKHTLHSILFLYSFMRLKYKASVAYLTNYCYT